MKEMLQIIEGKIKKQGQAVELKYVDDFVRFMDKEVYEEVSSQYFNM